MRFERCFNPDVIPKSLIDQLPGNAFDALGFYNFMHIAVRSPTQLLYVLLSGSDIKGFLWSEINILERSMFINTLSVDRDLWGNGEMVRLATEFLKQIFESLRLLSAYWITDKPALFEKMGFKRSKNILLEYTGGDYGNN